MDDEQPASGRPLAPFFVIWTGQQFSLLGSNLVQFALVWWLTQTTGSATILATATLVAVLPQIVLSPLAGALIDRWSRRKVMMTADSLIALATLLLATLFALDMAQVWHIYVIMFFRAAMGAFHWPAMQASTTLMVPGKHLSRVAGLNQTMQGVVGIISPPLGALLLGWLPMQGILAIDVVTALMAVVPLVFIAVPQPERRTTPAGAGEASRPNLLSDLWAGLRYVWGWPGLMLIALLAALINLLVSPGFSLMPILVIRHFGGAAMELGWLESAFGIGMVTGGLTLSVWGGFRRRIVTGMAALIGMGAGVLLLGLTPASLFGMGVAAMFLAGFMNPIANGALFSSLQATVAPDMQGRVFTLTMSLSGAMMPLGLAIAGPIADTLGVQVWFLVGGTATLLMGLGAFFVPAIMTVEEQAERLVASTGPA
jgi:DHA3 family macrolide efflux protein-like MFS transporter